MSELERVIHELAEATGEHRQRLIDQHLSRLPLLRTTVLDLLAEDDRSWLQTGGALRGAALDALSDHDQENSGAADEPELGELRPGQRLGTIRIEQPLGHGGMGKVVLGHDEALDRKVAIKTLRGSLVLQPRARERFEQEAKILSRLDHPAICKIHGLIEEQGVQHLVLELVAGRTLREAAEDLDSNQVLAIAESVADALVAAHGEGVVHRDLKPENIMITDTGSESEPELGPVKVLDFGIARIDRKPETAPIGREEEIAASEPLLTRLGALMGTIAYMSPEQARGEAASAASDLYSLGLILHELSSETPPLPAGLSGPEVLEHIAAGRLDAATGVGAELEALLARLCHIDPQRRGDARRLRRDLAELRDAPQRRRRRRWRQTIGGAVLAIIAAAAGLALEARWSAQQQAARIESFSRRAAEVVWRLRALELAPRHDIGSSVERLLAELTELERGLENLGSDKTKAAGRRSLGRAYFALGETAEALRHLEPAGASGDAESAWWLGRTYGELYRESLVAAAAIDNEELRTLAVVEADARWRRPALEALSRGQEWPDADLQLASALLAFYERRYEEANQRLEAASGRPWSAESPLLAGDIAHSRAQEESLHVADAAGYDAGLIAAQEHYRRAVSIARSSPKAHGRLCRVAAERVRVAAGKRLRPVPGDEIDEMWRLCDAAAGVDSEDPAVHLAVASAHQAEGAAASARGDDPAPSFRRAIEELDRESRRERDATDRRLMRASIGVDLAYRLVQTGDLGEESERVIAQSAADLEAVWQARSDPAAAMRLGNLRMVEAFRAHHRSESPMDAVEAALPVLEEALARYPKIVDLHTTLGNLWLVAGRHRAQVGDSAVESYAAAARHFAVGAETGDIRARSNQVLVLGDLGHAQQNEGLDPLPSWRRAIDIADSVLAEDPNLAALYGYRSLVHFRLGSYRLELGDDPLEALSAALADNNTELALGSESADTQLALIYIPLRISRWHLLKGHPQDARLTDIDERLQRLAGKMGDLGDFRGLKAQWWVQRGWSTWLAGGDPRPDWQEGEERIARALDSNPDSAPWQELGLSLAILRARWAGQSGHDEATHQAALRERLAALPKGVLRRATLELGQAIAYGLGGDHEKARRAFAKAQEADPTSERRLRLLAPELSEVFAEVLKSG